MTAVADGAPRQIVVGVHESLARQAIRRFLRHRLAIVGVVILVVIVAAAVFAPLLVPLDPLKTDYSAIRRPPGPGHPLGSDLSGRDILARVVHGTRISLVVGFGAVALYVVVGTALGMLAGFGGGVRDQLVMRLTDILLAIPLILLCIVFISIVGPGLVSVIAVIGLLGWPQTTRVVRGQLLSLREACLLYTNPSPRDA
jgi:peptide/nickel transport system permease protein